MSWSKRDDGPGFWVGNLNFFWFYLVVIVPGRPTIFLLLGYVVVSIWAHFARIALWNKLLKQYVREDTSEPLFCVRFKHFDRRRIAPIVRRGASWQSFRTPYETPLAL
jgi:hypothetical protein